MTKRVQSVIPYKPTMIAMVGGSAGSETAGERGVDAREPEGDEFDGQVLDDGLGAKADS